MQGFDKKNVFWCLFLEEEEEIEKEEKHMDVKDDLKSCIGTKSNFFKIPNTFPASVLHFHTFL